MNQIFITGGSKGLGKEIIKRIKSNNNQIINLSRSKSNIKDIKNVIFDLNKINTIESFLKKNITIKKNKFKSLILNSAYGYDDIVTNLEIKNLQKMININLIANMIIVKFFIRKAILNKTKLSIVFISSISTKTGYKGLSMYAASKGGLEAFSKNIAREWGKFGIRSNCVSPGFMETNMTSKIKKELKIKIFKRGSIKGPIKTKSVAETVKYLISNNSESITGQNIVVDNGSL